LPPRAELGAALRGEVRCADTSAGGRPATNSLLGPKAELAGSAPRGGPLRGHLRWWAARDELAPAAEGGTRGSAPLGSVAAGWRRRRNSRGRARRVRCWRGGLSTSLCWQLTCGLWASFPRHCGQCFCALALWSVLRLRQARPRRPTACAAATSVATCDALPRSGARCLCGPPYRGRASRRAQVRLHRRPSWRRRQPRSLRRCGLTNEPPDCALRGAPPDASPSVPTWYWPRSRSIAFRRRPIGYTSAPPPLPGMALAPSHPV